MPFAENLGSGGSALDAQYGSSSAPNTNSPLLLDPRTSGNFVYTPGSAGNYVSVPHADSLNILGTEGTKRYFVPPLNGNYASTPDTAALDITGDLDLRVRVAPSVWSSLTSGTVMAKTGTGQRSFIFEIENAASPKLNYYWTQNGSTNILVQSSASMTFTAGDIRWVRVTHATATGSVDFYTSSDGTTWTPLGTTQTTTIGARHAGTADLFFGSVAGISSFSGDIYRAQIYASTNGTDLRFDADFTTQTIGSRGFIESTGKLVTLTGAAAQIVDGTTYGFAPGVSGAYWSTPDVAALDITGNIEVVARCEHQTSVAASRTIICKMNSSASEYSWTLENYNGTLYFIWTTGGTSASQVFATSSLAALTVGTTYWFKATMTAATGKVDLYYAADQGTEPTSWTTLPTGAGAGATSIYSGSAPLAVGAHGSGSGSFTGKFYRAIVRNGIGGTKVFDADFTRQIQFASSFTEATGKVVTTQGAARIERERNVELIARVALDDWTPASLQFILGKWTTTGDQRSYLLGVTTAGTLIVFGSTTGTAATETFKGSTVAVPFTDGQIGWVKAVIDVSAGAQYTVEFYTAADSSTEPVVWTQLGTTVTTAGAFSLFPSIAEVQQPSSLAGKVLRSIIRNGINGPAVLDLDFTSQITSGGQSVIEPASGATIPQAVQYAPNLGTGGAALNARYGSSTGADSNDPLLLEHSGTNYLYLPGVSGNHASTPDSAALDITGDIDLRARVALDDWTPAAETGLIEKSDGGAQRTYSLRIATDGKIFLYWSTLGTAVSEIAAASTVATGLADGSTKWVRATLDIDNPSNPGNGYRVQFFTSDDGVTWAQLGADVNGAASTSIHAGTSALFLGARGDNSRLLAGCVFRAQVLNGIGGTVVFDADFTTGITSGSQTTFTESSSNAATVTINRSTSGRKSVAVVRDVWLFGTDDYLEVADNDLLDFGASDSFTMVAVVRQWATIGSGSAIIAKANTNSNSATAARYLIRNGTSNTSYLILDDGVNIDTLEGTVTNTPGALSVIGESVTTSTIQPYLNGVAGSSSARVAGNLTNSQPLNIGRFFATGYADMELLGAAVFRRALTASEIALVNTHYQTGATAASNALLSESVWWIDAGRTAAAQINRSTTGRKSVACADCIWLLGTDDFFEVADNPLLDFDQGEDFTLLSLVRVWDFQGTNDSLIAKSSSNTAGAAGYGLATGGTNPLTTTARLGDGSTGASVSTLARVPSRLVAVWAWRDTPTGTLHIALNNAASTSTPDLTTGNSANSLALRLGALSGTASEFLDGEVKSTAIWRRTLTASERAAVNNYYGTI